MWYFDTQKSSNIDYDFEQLDREVDMNEQTQYSRYKAKVESQKQIKFQNNVCTHWLREVCSRGNFCDHLHSYVPESMPPCTFFQKGGHCTNPDCIYSHNEDHQNKDPCLYYLSGFCYKGNHCLREHKYLDTPLCLNYLAGFCPAGPKCLFKHPKWPHAE